MSRHAARTFNTMQARLSRFIEDRTRILSAISHDLRTPITRLRLRAELLEDEDLRDSLLKDLDEMQTMTSAALDFLRGLDAQEPVQPVDLRTLLESLKADAEDLGRSVELQASPSAPYPARPLALKRCLSNLLDNALKYGGRACVTLEEGAQQVQIRIADVPGRGAGCGEAPCRGEGSVKPYRAKGGGRCAAGHHGPRISGAGPVHYPVRRTSSLASTSGLVPPRNNATTLPLGPTR